MKIHAFTVLLLMSAILLCMPVSAASYIDNMDSLINDGIKQYSGLMQHSFSMAAVSVVPDATALTFSGGRLISYADYRVNGATSVAASIYSQCGTFVCQQPDDRSQYMLGIFKEKMDFLASSGLTQALYCAATDGVYTREGGLKQMYTDLNAYYFGNVITPPQGELIGYGVNFYFSNDGQSFTRVQAVYAGLNYNVTHAYCLEYYTASIPSAAKYVRVEINDFAMAPLAWGGSRAKDKKLQTSLASVEISGNGLTTGEPESKVELFTVPSSESSVKGYYSAEGSNAKDAASNKSAKSSGQTEHINESSSKFEGTISSSTKSSRSSSKSERASRRESAASKASAEASVDEISRDETIVYDIKRSGEKTDFDKGVIAYVIVVSGVILALAVLPKRK